MSAHLLKKYTFVIDQSFKLQLKHAEIFRLKSIKRELKEQDQITAERVQRRAQAKVEKMLKPAMLSNYKFEEPVSFSSLLNQLKAL
jgi:hypothetical protein